jgi:RimJ/RimL family protein N-acetyltransferase
MMGRHTKGQYGMIELTRDEYARTIPLFKDIDHSRSFVFSLFEGNHTGRVFVDRREQPVTALLALTCEFWCLGGRDDNPIFNQALHDWVYANLKPDGNHVLFLPFTEAWRGTLAELFKDRGIMTIKRSAFDFSPERFKRQQAGWRERIPPGYRIEPYDRGLAETAGGLAEFWGTIDNFLAHGLGYAVLDGDEVLSRCHTVFVGDCEAEISIETSEKHRRQGLGTLAVCAFVEGCRPRGLRPEWSCWSNNAASISMAQKIGFVPKADVQVSYFYA